MLVGWIRRLPGLTSVAVAALILAVIAVPAALAGHGHRHPSHARHHHARRVTRHSRHKRRATRHLKHKRPSGGTVPRGRGPGAPGAGAAPVFATGQLQATVPGDAACGANQAAEPAIHVSRADAVFTGSEDGVGNGSELWRALAGLGGQGASPCLEYRGRPNSVANFGLAGGDIDIALASQPGPTGAYNVYVASLNLASVNVATSLDNGTTFTQGSPVVAGLPGDDREWIAAYGAHTSLLTYHDVATNNIDVLRSDSDGLAYHQIARVIPDTDYKAGSNQHGNLVIDHRSVAPGAGGFYAYQSFVAPSDASGAENNEAFLGVSADGGQTWTDRAIPCSTSTRSLDHNFPNVSVDPGGSVWYSWSDDQNVYVAKSVDHGQTWACSGPVSTNTGQAIFPWLAATSHGVDLVFYGSPTAAGKGTQTWYAYFAQSLSGAPGGFSAPQQVVAVHRGPVCEVGFGCTSGRQLFDDFGVDTDSRGFAHIAYSHDSPDLGGAGSYTGSAVQTGGSTAGSPNN